MRTPVVNMEGTGSCPGKVRKNFRDCDWIEVIDSQISRGEGRPYCCMYIIITSPSFLPSFPSSPEISDTKHPPQRAYLQIQETIG
jgi:hypothetical protein